MEAMESCVPPGFRFHPTDEELVGYYLRKKVASQKIDLDVIRDIDLYRIEPWDLQEQCRFGYEEQSEWYFFSHKDKKYPSGTRTNRATMAGFWKATGRDKAIYQKMRLIGMRKTLVFYKGRAPNGQKTDWIMHEYRLETNENGPPQEEGWVVCRAFKKRSNVKARDSEAWEPSYTFDEPSGLTSILDSTHNHQRQVCKKETEALDHHLKCIYRTQPEPFMHHLPMLQSPSLPLIKTLSSLENDHEDQEDHMHCLNKISTEKVRDWRALDKFVASQLSQGDSDDSNFGGLAGNQSVEMALLLLQSGREDATTIDEFLSSGTSDCPDIGICLCEK